MHKQFKLIYLSTLLIGCNPQTKYSVHKEYVETNEVDPKKGWVNGFKASYQVEWE